MSYILEALTNSERARQQIAAGPRFSLLPVVGEELPHPRRWLYALAVTLLLNVAVLQVWMRPNLHSDVASIKASAVPQVAEASAGAPEQNVAPAARGEAPVTERESSARRQLSASQPRRGRSNEPHVSQSAAPANVRPESPVAFGPGLKEAPASAPKTTTKPGVDTSVVTGKNAHPTQPFPPSSMVSGGTAELPAVLQPQLPALSVAGFIHDEGAGSFVIVNDRLMREGDEVAPGVKLEKILKDGVIFEYKGAHFRR